MPFVCNVWTTWTAQVTCATTNIVWDVWSDCSQSTTATTAASHLYIPRQQQLTEEQQAELEIDRRRRIAQTAAYEAKRTAARERARELLLSYLTHPQREELEREGAFSVIGGASGRRYRINAEERPGNVEVLDRAGRRSHRLCAHDRSHGTPWPDQLLAQKFYLEHHEDEFLAVANRH